MPVDFPLAGGLTSLTVVTGVSDRDTRFPNPNTNQLAYDLGTQAVERWNGAAWVVDISFNGTTAAQTFNALVTASMGVLITGSGIGSGYADYLTLNAARTNGGQVGVSLYGTSTTGSQDVRLVNDGSGNTYLYSGGAQVAEIDKSGNLIMLVPSSLLWTQIGGHQQIDGWYLVNVSANQSNVQMSRFTNTAEFVSAAAGYITGIGIQTSGSVTGGTCSAVAFVNGVSVGSPTVTVAIGTTFAALTYRPPGVLPANLTAVAFPAGASIDVRLTTASGWTFTTGTVRATLEIVT